MPSPLHRPRWRKWLPLDQYIMCVGAEALANLRRAHRGSAGRTRTTEGPVCLTRRRARRGETPALLASGMPRAKIAELFGVAERVIYADIALHRSHGQNAQAADAAQDDPAQ